MTWSGLMISTSCVGSMSAAVTGPVAAFFSLSDRFGAVVQLQHHALEVEQDVDDVLLHAVERRVLVQHAGDLAPRSARSPGIEDSSTRRSALPSVWP